MGRAILSTACFVGGVVWSSAVSHQGDVNRVAATLSGLLIIVGLTGVIVTAIQFPWTRK